MGEGGWVGEGGWCACSDCLALTTGVDPHPVKLPPPRIRICWEVGERPVGRGERGRRGDDCGGRDWG